MINLETLLKPFPHNPCIIIFGPTLHHCEEYTLLVAPWGKGGEKGTPLIRAALHLDVARRAHRGARAGDVCAHASLRVGFAAGEEGRLRRLGVLRLAHPRDDAGLLQGLAIREAERPRQRLVPM